MSSSLLEQKEHPKDAPYQGPRTCWAMNMGKAVEGEDPLIRLEVNVV